MTRGFQKVSFPTGLPFLADQRFREKYCPGNVRSRDGRMLYGSRLEAELEFYMELDVQDLDL